MPTLSNPSLWRDTPTYQLFYTYVDRPPTVYSGTITQDPIIYSVTEFTYEDGAGSLADVKSGMTVKITNSANVFKGWARITFLPTSEKIFIAPVSRGTIDFQETDLFYILDDYRIWSKIPFIHPTSGEQFKDWRISFSAVYAMPPISCPGPWFIGFASPISGEISVTFPGATLSFPTAPGRTIDTYLWDIGDGTYTSGSSSTGNITATFPIGRRWVHLTVTDSAGIGHEAHCLVVVLDPDEIGVINRIAINSLNGSIDGGWELTFEMFDEDASDVEPGAIVMMFAEEVFGGVAGSLNGYSGRQHIKFVGYLREEEIIVQPAADTIIFTAYNPIQILGTLPAFPQTMVHSESPAQWSEVDDLTWWRAVIYLLFWHSTVLDLFPIIRPSDYADYPYPQIDASGGTFVSQMQFLVAAIAKRFTCDRNGILYTRDDIQFMSDAERLALTQIVALTDADWQKEISYVIAHHPILAVLYVTAIVSHQTDLTVVKSIAPGLTPDQGETIETISQWLVTSQYDANDRTGKRFAYRNRKLKSLSLTMRQGGLVADPAWLEYIRFTSNPLYNRRGLSIFGLELMLTGVRVNFEHAQANSTEIWVFEPIVSALTPKGVTQSLPGSGEPEPDPDDPNAPYIPDPGTWVEQPVPPLVFPPVEIPEPGEVTEPSIEAVVGLIAWTADSLYIGDPLTPADPIWTDVLTPTGEAIVDVVAVGPVVYVLTDDGLHVCEDIINDFNTWAKTQTFTGGQQIRRTSEGNVIVRGLGPNTVGSWTVTIDFTDVNDRDIYDIPESDDVDPDNEAEFNWMNPAFPAGYGSYGEFTEGVGLETADGYLDSAGYNRRAHALIHRWDYIHLDSMEMTFDVTSVNEPNTNNRKVEMRGSINGAAPTAFLDQQLNVGNGQVKTVTPNQDNVAGLNIYVQPDFNGSSSTLIGYAKMLSWEINGTGFNPTTDTMWVKHITSLGTVVDTNNFAQNTRSIGMDVDDYDLGVVALNIIGKPWVTSDYNSDTYNRITPVPWALPNSGKIGSLVLIPQKVLLTQVANSDPASLQVIYATTGTASVNQTDGALETMWAVSVDTTTGEVDVVNNMTPIIDTERYAVQDMNGMQTAGANTQVMLAFAQNLTDSTNHLIRSIDGATNWADLGTSFDGSYVWFVPGSTLQLWFAGPGGVRYSANRGTTLQNASGGVLTENVLGVLTISS